MKTVVTIVLLVLGAVSLRSEEAVPDGFVMQVLEPTGGKIVRPEKWFYCEGHREHAFMWTISKEDTVEGKFPYDTGVRIQAFAGILEATGQSPEDFIRGFFAKTKGKADVVHKTCEATDQGLFTRICLEVTEGEYRILYSLFWGNGMDMAVISIAGAKREDWDLYSDTFNRMSSFELIDMERFPEDKEKGESGGAR